MKIHAIVSPTEGDEDKEQFLINNGHESQDYRQDYKDFELLIECGNGEQILRWLAFISLSKYSESLDLPSNSFQPRYVLKLNHDGPPSILNPYSMLSNHLSDGDSVIVSFSHEEPNFSLDKDPMHCMNPFDYDDLLFFSDSVYMMLQDPDLFKFAGWSSSGHSLVIYDKNSFSKKLVGKYLPYTDIDFFSKNLNRCGFLLSWPPPELEDDSKAFCSEELRLEFVHPFGANHKGKTLQEWRERVQLYVQKTESNTILANQPSENSFLPGENKDIEADDWAEMEIAERRDAQLQNILDRIHGRRHFSSFFKFQLGMDHYLPLENSNEELTRVQKLFLHYTPILRAFFRYYCYSYGEKINALAIQEFFLLCRNCNIPDVNVTPKVIEAVFIEANRPGQIPDEEEFQTEIGDTVRHFVFHEFLASLVLLANRKFKNESDSMSDRLELLLKKHIDPVAQYHYKEDYHLLSDFSEMLSLNSVKTVINKCETKMQHIFKDHTGGNALGTISSFELFSFLQKTAGMEHNLCKILSKRAYGLSNVFLGEEDGNVDIDFELFMKTICLSALLNDDHSDYKKNMTLLADLVAQGVHLTEPMNLLPQKKKRHTSKKNTSPHYALLLEEFFLKIIRNYQNVKVKKIQQKVVLKKKKIVDKPLNFSQPKSLITKIYTR